MNFVNRYRPYFNQIVKLSYPIIIGQLGIVLMGVTDIMIVGHLDAVNLAAASLANSVYFLICILGLGTLSAVSALVAKSRGAGHPNQCVILYRQSIVASLLLAALVIVVAFILTENLEWFKQSQRVTDLTRSYLHILNVGTLPLMLFQGTKQFSDGLGRTKPAAIITLVALVMNLALNWVFVFGNLGAPAWGLFGSGLATTISRIWMAMAMWFHIKMNSSYKTYLHLKEHENDREYLIKIFKVGLPSGFQYFFEIGAFAFSAIMIGWISDMAMAAHQVAINVASVTYMLASGISAGGAIAVGEAFGRRNRKDVVDAGRAALIMGTVFMGICMLILALFAPFIVSMYTEDPLVSGMAVSLLLIAALFQLSDGIQCVSLGILRGLHDTRIPTIITIIAYWVIGIPLAYIFGFWLNWSLYGVWFALLVALSFSAVLLSIRFLKESREIDLNYHSGLEEDLHVH